MTKNDNQGNFITLVRVYTFTAEVRQSISFLWCNQAVKMKNDEDLTTTGNGYLTTIILT